MTSSFKPIVGEVLLYGDKCLFLFVLLSFNRKDAQLAGKGKETNNANITIHGKFTTCL